MVEIAKSDEAKSYWNLKEKFPKLELKLPWHRAFTYPLDYGREGNVDTDELIKSGLFLNSRQKPQCIYCDLIIHNLDEWKEDIDDKHLMNSPHCILMKEFVDELNEEPIERNYVFESWR
jgi:hypothetical protein